MRAFHWYVPVVLWARKIALVTKCRDTLQEIENCSGPSGADKSTALRLPTDKCWQVVQATLFPCCVVHVPFTLPIVALALKQRCIAGASSHGKKHWGKRHGWPMLQCEKCTEFLAGEINSNTMRILEKIITSRTAIVPLVCLLPGRSANFFVM